ncbi:MAG: 50S ribosomal protein L23 [Deltaproteobacteria bacterium]|nr:50S ribosomal protein L23 [Deltaproteobacteria bacterium]
MRSPQSIIKRPLLTEKGTQLRETGGRPEAPSEPEEFGQKVLFEVSRDANKIEIRQAIEKLFKVRVASVRTQIVRGKEKRIGRFSGRRPNWKKAIVTLEPGDTIQLFEGA